MDLDIDPAAREFHAGKPDVEVTLADGRKAAFLVAGRRVAITEGLVPGEVRAYGGEFLRLLPIRPEDLYESHNQLAPQPKETEHEHDHEHGHDEHDLH